MNASREWYAHPGCSFAAVVCVFAATPSDVRPVVAQLDTVVTLRGSVSDASTVESLAGAAVLVASLGVVTLTTESGVFELPVTRDTHVLTIRKRGYHARSFKFSIANDTEPEVDIGVVPLVPGDEQVAPLTGVITSLGAAVPRASVILNGRLVAVANEDGRFEVARVELGPNVLEIRRIGFRPEVLQVDMPNVGTANVTVAMDAVALQLEEIVVDADRTVYATGRIREFYERRQRGLGHYFTQWEIERANPIFVSDLFRRVAGVRVTPGSFGGNRITMVRSSCAPSVYIDGMRIRDAEVDDLVWPDVVQGIEVYNGTATAPPQYAGFDSVCGVILIWTR